MKDPQITIVLEYKETTGDAVFPVAGRSGNVHGYATMCPRRGTMCWRLPIEKFQLIKEDIFGAKRSIYYPVPDVEIEYPPAGAQAEEAAAQIEELSAGIASRDAEIVALKAQLESLAENPGPGNITADPPPAEAQAEASSEPEITPSEAGAILGNGIPEAEDTAAAQVLSKKAKESRKPGKASRRK